MSDSTIVCILGMHRSGTSVLARVLNLLGVYLGPANRMLPPGPDNPRGFWEHQPIMKLNELILDRLGGESIDPPPSPLGWQNAPEYADLRQAAQGIIQADFRDVAVWGWKDPRTCLTLPLWQTILPSMRYVLTVRSPVEVARSLGQRDGLPLEWAVHLCLAHLRSSLIHTAARPRILIAYEDLLASWREKVPLLADFIGKPELAAQSEVLGAIEAFLDTGLRHHRAARSDRPPHGDTSATAEAIDLAQQTYVALRQDGLARHDHVCALVDRALALLDPEVRRQKQRYREQQEREWRGHLTTLRENLAEAIPEGATFILVDEEQTGVKLPGRQALPFLEQDGIYWGLPADDETAVRELERLRQAGARFLALAWPAFGWLEYYPRFQQYLRGNFPCLRENDSLILFDLRC